MWRRGSVIASWLLDLTAAALVEDPALSRFAGRVSDPGEGRWTIKAAVDEAVPVPVLSAALYQRFSSRGEADYQDKLVTGRDKAPMLARLLGADTSIPAGRVRREPAVVIADRAAAAKLAEHERRP